MQVGQTNKPAVTTVCTQRWGEYVASCFAKVVRNSHLLHATMHLEPKLALALHGSLNKVCIKNAVALEGGFSNCQIFELLFHTVNLLSTLLLVLIRIISGLINEPSHLPNQLISRDLMHNHIMFHKNEKLS